MGMVTAFACFIKLYLVACHFFYNVESTNIVAFVGIGYDLLKGNPEGDYNLGGPDPGFRLARNIFKQTYTRGKSGTFNGASVQIPDQMSYQPLSSCSSRESVRVYDGTKSYLKKLDINTEIEASGSYGLYEFRFSLSAGYSSVERSVQSTKKVVMDKTVICSKGQIRYNIATARHTASHRISDEFYYSVKDLPLTYNEGKYVQFIKNWGTHFIDSATLGGRLISRYESTQAELYKFASENVKSSVSVGGSKFGFEASAKVDIDKLNQQMSQSSTFGSKKNTIHSGSRIIEETNKHWQVPKSDRTTPIPIHVSMKPITDALHEGLWKDLPGGSYESLQISKKLKNLKIALRRYPVLANAKKSSDPALIFPNAWPDGSYSLLKTKYGCPSGGYQFTWREGFIRQDNEDDNNKNKCPRPFYLTDHCHRDLRLFYCSKTVTNKDYMELNGQKDLTVLTRKGHAPAAFQ